MNFQKKKKKTPKKRSVRSLDLRKLRFDMKFPSLFDSITRSFLLLRIFLFAYIRSIMLVMHFGIFRAFPVFQSAKYKRLILEREEKKMHISSLIINFHIRLLKFTIFQYYVAYFILLKSSKFLNRIDLSS